MEEVKPKNIFETPQGDERLGWTGDAEIFCRTACFLENTYSFYRKWLRDVEADQTEEGGVAHVVPDIISGNEGDNWLLEQGSHSAAARRFKIPGNTVEFVRDLRYNKYRVFTGLQNEQKKKGWGRMIDIAHAKQEFEKYLDEYDREDEQICLKIVHTYGVIRCSEEIGRRMGLQAEDMELAKLIALLHDIGRFEQLKRFNSFEADTMDHATYGVQVLFEEGMIRQFIEEDTWDDVIRTAIAKHSDYELTGITDERTLLHARLIRDADKLDNCRVKLEDAMETLLDLSADEVGKYAISPKVREDAFAGKCICSKDRRTPMDYWVSYVAYFYDLNFRETLDIVAEEQYVKRIIGRVPYTNEQTKKTMEELERQLTEYVRRK